jgi:hypothetical protein
MQVHIVAKAIDEMADQLVQSSVAVAEKLLAGKILTKNQHAELLAYWETDRQKMRRFMASHSQTIAGVPTTPAENLTENPKNERDEHDE